MSQREIDRYTIIRKVIAGELTGVRAAILLKLSIRHAKRLKAVVKLHGAKGLVHGNRGHPSNRSVPPKERKEIICLLKKHYADFAPTFASEKLAEQHGIVRDPGTIRVIQIAEGLWKPRAKRKQIVHRQWRRRKDQYGELVQFDGSYEYWFEDRGSRSCLLAAIDDATGKIIAAIFAEHEGVIPVFSFWRDYCASQGKPRAIYLDKFSTYSMNHALAKENTDTKTQFGRVAATLGIEVIFAHSPEAKGRVERLFLTLQDRLIKELRLRKITTITAANQFLKDEYIMLFNRRFSVQATQKGDLHRALTAHEKKVVSSVFARHTERTVRNDFTVSLNCQWYQLTKQQIVTICKKDRVTMEEHLDGSIHIRLRGKILNYQLLPERPKATSAQPWVIAATSVKTNQPAYGHPWRRTINANVLAQQNAKKRISEITK